MKAPAALQTRLLLGLIGAMSALWLATAAMIWFDARHELDELLDAHLTQAAAMLVAQQARDTDNDNDDPLMETPTLHRYSRQVAFQVWRQGMLTLRSANAPLEHMVIKALGFETRSLNGEEWRVFSTPGEAPDVLVIVAEQTAARSEITKAILRGLLGPLLLSLPLIVMVAWVLIGRAMRPLRQLSASLSSRQAAALTPLASPPGTPAEIMPVILALNTLLERVNQLLQGERRFIADAAHELRTPIAGLRAQAQAALGATSPAERKHALLSTLQGCDRASHLVQQLLTLSRIDAALPEPLQANVDLEGLVRGVALSLAPTALAAGQCLELETATAGPGQQRLAGVRSAQPAPVLIKGVDALLRVLVRNLIENALRYGSTGVTVRVRVASLPTGFISLSVEDSGPGLSATDLARLGERFFRALGNASTGSGLGWSIVQRIAQVHGAEIHAESPGALGGLSVHVSFPTT